LLPIICNNNFLSFFIHDTIEIIIADHVEITVADNENNYQYDENKN